MKKILYFTAAWCGPCKTLGPVMDSLSGQINFQKVDVDGNQDMSIKYGVRNVPFINFSRTNQGVTKGRLVGMQSKEAILNFYNG